MDVRRHDAYGYSAGRAASEALFVLHITQLNVSRHVLNRIIIQHKATIAELRERDPAAAQLIEDYTEWRDAACSNRLFAFSCALGLHRDPSRGRTHLVIGELEYTPSASKDIRYKFRISKCGVFRIADVLADVERAADLKASEGKAYVEKYIAEANAMDRSGGRTPILVLMVSPDFNTSIKPCKLPSTYDHLYSIGY